MVLLTKGALKKRIQTPLDLNLLLFWLSRACQWAIRLTLDSHILITLDFFNTLLNNLKSPSHGIWTKCARSEEWINAAFLSALLQRQN